MQSNQGFGLQEGDPTATGYGGERGGDSRTKGEDRQSDQRMAVPACERWLCVFKESKAVSERPAELDGTVTRFKG